MPDDFKISSEERIIFKNIKDVCAAVNLPRNLWVWLDSARGCDAAKNVAPGNCDCWRRAKDATGVKLPKDVLRHSFASYGYHYLGAEHTVEILGHIGGFGIFAKHYKELANAADAKNTLQFCRKKRRVFRPP